MNRFGDFDSDSDFISSSFEPPTTYPPFPAPRRTSHKSWKNGGKLQFIWPKDKPNMGKMARLKDCLTNRGPDIFIADRWGWEEPHRPVWSGWKSPATDPYYERWDNIGYPFRQDTELRNPWSTKAARRSEKNGQRYDFLTRRYVKPKGGEWTDAIWDPDHPKQALYHRDVDGNVDIEPRVGYWHSPVNPFFAGEREDRRKAHPGRYIQGQEADWVFGY